MPKKAVRRKKTTPKRRKKTTTKRRRNPISRSAASKRAKKAAATRKRKHLARVRAGKKAAATRRRKTRRNPAPKRKRRVTRKRRNTGYKTKATANPRRRRKRRASPTRKRRRSYTPRRRRRNTAMAKVNHKRANPTRRRRRRRRNPANGVMDIMKQTVSVGASLYLSRIASQKIAKMPIPGLSAIPAKFQGPAMAGALFGAGHFATSKVAALKKWRSGIMVGLGLNLLDSLIISFAPQNVKSMFGLADYDEDIYGPSLSDYVSVDDYVSVGDAPPIEDDITLADYVEVGQAEDDFEGLEEELGDVEQELGMLEQDLGEEVYQDLGAEMDLGGFADRKLGGVTRSSMRSAIRRKRYAAPVPARSFTKAVPKIGSGFDKPNKLYTGIFSGGFGTGC